MAGTNPTIRDTDGNGISDANEDPDGDGLTNLEEQGWGSHPALADSDDDGINDKIEVMFGASPIHPMSIIVDGDGNRLTDAVIAALPVSGVLVPPVGADVCGYVIANNIDTSEWSYAQAPAISLAIGKGAADASIETYRLPEPDRFAVGKGDFTVEMWVKKSTVEPTATREWLFTFVGATGYAYRLGLDVGGQPIGQIYHADTGAVLATAGGAYPYRKAGDPAVSVDDVTPPLEDDTWTHLALVWSHDSKSLVLYRDRLAIIGSATVSNADVIDFGTTATRAVIGKLTVPAGGLAAIDEFRAWTSARSEEQIDYWAGRIIPAPLTPTLEIRYMREDYPLVANYRFDDGGQWVEDFAHFRNRRYMLSMKADVMEQEAKVMEG